MTIQTKGVSPELAEVAQESGETEPGARWQLYACCILLVACTISWRRQTYFTGGLDPVVAAKGVIGVVAAGIAALLAHRRSAVVSFGGRTVAFAALYLSVSLIGGASAGTLLPAAVIVVRVVLMLTTIALLISVFGPERFTAAIMTALGAALTLAVVTGVGSVTSGRLAGGIPPMAPNEIALQSGLIAIYAAHRLVAGERRPIFVALVFVPMALMWLTGSRTTTATAVLALLIVTVQARRFSPTAFCGLVLAVPLVAYATFATGAVSGLLLRGGDQNIGTLSSRTIAWNAALTMDVSTYQRWFGGGLTLKRIPVTGQYWNEQLLDSSWISALVQTGLVGFCCVVLWVGATFVASVRADWSTRLLLTGWLTFIVLRSVLESGLFDASTAFIAFATVSLTSEARARAPQDASALARVGTAPGVPRARATGGPGWRAQSLTARKK